MDTTSLWRRPSSEFWLVFGVTVAYRLGVLRSISDCIDRVPYWCTLVVLAFLAFLVKWLGFPALSIAPKILIPVKYRAIPLGLGTRGGTDAKRMEVAWPARWHIGEFVLAQDRSDICRGFPSSQCD